MLLAIASRETNMQDIVGDGGHGRGLFQIDDRFHGDWLAKHGAPGAGTTPRIKDAADYAAAMLASNVAYAQKKKVGEDQQVRFAASAYNAGCGGAFSGFQAGNCDLKTTGGDYGSDVLERLAAIQGKNGGDPTGGGGAILERGSRGPGGREAQARPQALVRRERTRRLGRVQDRARARLRRGARDRGQGLPGPERPRSGRTGRRRDAHRARARLGAGAEAAARPEAEAAGGRRSSSRARRARR